MMQYYVIYAKPRQQVSGRDPGNSCRECALSEQNKTKKKETKKANYDTELKVQSLIERLKN